MSSRGSRARTDRATVSPPNPLSRIATGDEGDTQHYRAVKSFTLTILRRSTTLAHARPIGESAMSANLEGKRVLLVDDDNDILTSMQAAFEPTGATIDTANNGNKAVELAEKTQPDLVVLDMMLPGRSGFLVLEKIKSKKPRSSKPFVIMITGNQGARHKMYAESLGVSEYFHKPVKLDKLIARAEQLLTAPPPAAPNP
jgi:CheY-like chemotaxis protein